MLKPHMKKLTVLTVIALVLFSIVPLAALGASPWAPNTAYAANDLVTYGGSTYKCVQGHTSLTGWEPPNVPALWTLQAGSGDTSPPTAPTNLISPANTSSTVSLAWTASTDNVGVTGYDIYQGTALVGSTTSTTFTVTGLTASTTYIFTAKAKDAAGNMSAGSNAVTVTTAPPAPDVTPPSVPTNLAAPAKSSTTVSLTWSASTDNVGVTGYDIYAGTTLVGSTAATSYTVTGLTASTAYVFTVKAKDGAGNVSVASASLGVTTNGASSGNGKIIVGYWHNFNNGTGFIPLRNVSAKYDVINISFAEPTISATDGTIGFTPYNYTVADFKADVAYLQSLGKKVLISIGGQNGEVQLKTAAAKQNFITSVTDIIQTFGFDGLDIDFEGHSLSLNAGDTDFKNPTTPVIVNTIAAIRVIHDHFGSSFMLTMAPETFFVQLGYQFYGSGANGTSDPRAGAFLPVIYALRDILNWIQVQDYNSGPIIGLDDQYHTMGGADFHVAMLDMLLSGFPVAHNTNNVFPALRPDQVVLGIPATGGAGNGYTAPAEVQKALNYIIKGQAFGGSYVLRNPSGYPGFKGLMTWSINWDAYSNFEFSNSHRTYLDSLN